MPSEGEIGGMGQTQLMVLTWELQCSLMGRVQGQVPLKVPLKEPSEGVTGGKGPIQLMVLS